MNSASNSISIKGAAMLLGSLYWEGEDGAHDGNKGKRRKIWRETYLDMTSCRDLTGIPIRYGRRSKNRGEYTMVFGGKPKGIAKIANFRTFLPITNGPMHEQVFDMLEREVEAMALAEEIRDTTNSKHYTNWGLVAIAINPKSPFKKVIKEIWKKFFKPERTFSITGYGKKILDRDAILKIPLHKNVWAGLDFCLATPTKPTLPNPSAKQIAILASKDGSYFKRTYKSGIRTANDNQIQKYLNVQAP